jgi:glycosyltransferase involved in cell wall biosynthesis
VWNEDDIIFATVRNLLEQGVDRVFVLDDESDDATVGEALSAGATVVQRTSTGRYAEADRSRSIQELIARETTDAGGDLWWLIVDADEFPRGPDGLTVRQHLATLPDWVDVVGSRVLDHVPSSRSRYQPRAHPVRSFPLARWYHNPYCPLGHWKHQLIRVRAAGDLVPMPGQHVARSGDGRQIREAPGSLLMHHFPIRGHSRTAERYAAANRPDGRYALSPDPFTRARLAQRIHALDAFYADRFDLVPNGFPGQSRQPQMPPPWTELVRATERCWPAER